METQEGDSRSQVCGSWELYNDDFVLSPPPLRTESTDLSVTEYAPDREYSLDENNLHNAIIVILASEAIQKNKYLYSLKFLNKQKR